MNKEFVLKNKILILCSILVFILFMLKIFFADMGNDNLNVFIKETTNLIIKTEDTKNISKDETDSFRGDGKRFIYFYIKPENISYYLQQKPFGIDWKKGNIIEACIDTKSRCIEEMESFGVPDNYKKDSIYYAVVKHYPEDSYYEETFDLQILILDPEQDSLTFFSSQS